MTHCNGWAWPHYAKKSHYFQDGIALCGKWLLFSPSPRVGGLNATIYPKEDCMACTRKVIKLRGGR